MQNGLEADISASIARLEKLCEVIPPLLEKIGEEDFTDKPSPSKWSRKQILGHLLDSAANNLHRLVRGQFEEYPIATYDQENWNRHSRHQQMPSGHLIRFWQHHNRHLLYVVTYMPREFLYRKLTIASGEKKEITLAFVFEDYVSHLEHHLRQIVDYKI